MISASDQCVYELCFFLCCMWFFTGKCLGFYSELLIVLGSPVEKIVRVSKFFSGAEVLSSFECTELNANLNLKACYLLYNVCVFLCLGSISLLCLGLCFWIAILSLLRVILTGWWFLSLLFALSICLKFHCDCLCDSLDGDPWCYIVTALWPRVTGSVLSLQKRVMGSVMARVSHSWR